MKAHLSVEVESYLSSEHSGAARNYAVDITIQTLM